MNWLSRRLSPKYLRPLLESRGAWKVVVGKSEEGKQKVSSHIGWCTSLSFPTNAFLDERKKLLSFLDFYSTEISWQEKWVRRKVGATFFH